MINEIPARPQPVAMSVPYGTVSHVTLIHLVVSALGY